MRFDRLDLNLLVALDVLLETRSVTETARRLNVSQPAVTGALNRLREFFQDELLVQSGRRMLSTRRAEELADPVRQALMLIRSDITRPGGFDPATARRRFVVVASDYAYAILIAGLVADVARMAPGVSFEIVPPCAEADDRFERAEVDIFINLLQYCVAEHPQMELWRDTDVIISAEDVGSDGLDADAFAAAGHAIAVFGPDRREPLSDAFIRSQGVERRIELVLSNFSALPQAVIGTSRLATMHRLYAEHFSRHYPIRIHETWIPFPEVVEVAQWHKVRAKDPGVQWLVGMLRAAAARLNADQRGFVAAAVA